MNIIVCDDNKIDLKILRKNIIDCLSETDIEVQIDTFQDASALTEDLLAKCDILFMDIYMPNINGFELVKEKLDSIHGQVVFVTATPDFAVDAFSVNARHYLLKPVTPEAVREALTRCMEHMDSQSESSSVIEVKTSLGTTSIPVERIVYIEVFNKISTIYVRHSEFQTYTPLGSLYESLNPDNFMRPNRSFIINMDYIVDFQYDHIVLKGGNRINLSRQNRKQLREQYQNYLLNKEKDL